MGQENLTDGSVVGYFLHTCIITTPPLPLAKTPVDTILALNTFHT